MSKYFDLSQTKTNSTIYIIGKRRYGKSTLVANIITKYMIPNSLVWPQQIDSLSNKYHETMKNIITKHMPPNSLVLPKQIYSPSDKYYETMTNKYAHLTKLDALLNKNNYESLPVQFLYYNNDIDIINNNKNKNNNIII